MNRPSRPMPPPPAIGSVRPKPKAKAEGPATASPPEDGGDGAEAVQEDAQTGAWSPVEAEIAQDDGPSDEPLASPPAAGSSPPSSSSASGLRVPSIEASSSASGLRAPSLGGASSASGLRAPSLGSAAVNGPADSAGSWPATDGWDFDEESESPSASKPLLDSPAKSPLPKVGRLPQLTPRPKASPSAERDAAPPRESLFSEPVGGDGPVSSLAAAASLATAASKDAAAGLEPPMAFEDAPSPAAAPAAVWDALPLLDAAPVAAGDSEVPSLDSAGLLGTAVVDAPDPAAGAAASVPRMPLPGMLRDGPAPKAADFRAAPRLPRAQTAGAMAPLPGVVPPSFRDDDSRRLEPGDTAAFMAQVAVELMETDRPADASLSASTADLGVANAGEEVVTEVSAAPPKIVPFALNFATTPAAETRHEGSRRGLWLGLAGLAAAVVLVVWMWGDRGSEPPSQVVTAPAATTPAPEAPTPATAEPLAPAPEEPLVAAAAADLEGTTSGDPLAADEDPEVSDSTGGEPALEASSGADEPEEELVEATLEPDAPHKPSGKTKTSKASRAEPKTEPTPEPKTNTEPKTDAPSPKKLLTQARSAYLAGKGSSAYGLASKSNRIEPSAEAAEVMALAACLMHNVDKARSALKAVPLLRRGSVRTACKNKHDVRVGI